MNVAELEPAPPENRPGALTYGLGIGIGVF